mmetsp:Transcript_395/g.740  ORF Transcript_395/g.740 Transcript_395/m.740 type:complete len:371 (-) Transcript_395:81-1193(-)
MSESDGLIKLTKFLNQTKRQAEQAIDCLNEKIAELEKQNEIERQKYEKCADERDYYRNYAEQLRLENSKKWRLQERDDWKALVDSVQKDRQRLQDECNALEHELMNARLQIDTLLEAAERADAAEKNSTNGSESEENDVSMDSSASPTPTSPKRSGNSCELANSSVEHSCDQPLPSPSSPRENAENVSASVNSSLEDVICDLRVSVDRTGSYSPSPSGVNGRPRTGSSPVTPQQVRRAVAASPSAIVRELNHDLSKAREELRILQGSSEAERLSQEQEISRLQEEHKHVMEIISSCPRCSSRIGTDDAVLIHPVDSDIVSRGAQPTPGHHIITNTSSSTTSSWSGFNIFGYFFSSSKPSYSPASVPVQRV